MPVSSFCAPSRTSNMLAKLSGEETISFIAVVDFLQELEPPLDSLNALAHEVDAALEVGTTGARRRTRVTVDDVRGRLLCRQFDEQRVKVSEGGVHDVVVNVGVAARILSNPPRSRLVQVPLRRVRRPGFPGLLIVVGEPMIEVRTLHPLRAQTKVRREEARIIQDAAAVALTPAIGNLHTGRREDWAVDRAVAVRLVVFHVEHGKHVAVL